MDDFGDDMHLPFYPSNENNWRPPSFNYVAFVYFVLPEMAYVNWGYDIALTKE